MYKSEECCLKCMSRIYNIKESKRNKFEKTRLKLLDGSGGGDDVIGKRLKSKLMERIKKLRSSGQ